MSRDFGAGWIALLAACFAFAQLPARAAAQAIEAHADPGLVIGGKLGASLGAPFNGFGNSPTFELELGYLLPLPHPIDHSLELFASGGYASPSSNGISSAADPRLPGDGKLHYELQHQILILSAGVLFRVPLPITLLSPYASLAWRGVGIDTRVRGSVGGESLGENHELGFEHGLAFGAGVDFFLGPGALLAELQITYAARDARVLRDTNLSTFVGMIGYRFMFGSRRGNGVQAEEPAPAHEPLASAKPEPEPEPEPEPAPEPAAAQPAPLELAPSAAAAAAGPAAGTGQIRGNVRSFDGDALNASVTVYPAKIKASADSSGAFSVDVPPGRYTVRIRAHGYKSQNRDVAVSENGVTILNVELGKK